MGGTWARTSDPQLVDSGQRSRRFAGVRSGHVVKRNLPTSERLSERERTLILAILATRVPDLGDAELANSDVSTLAQRAVL
jgi:hypothetical protein